MFVDETGANTKMVRVYGRCRRGQRLVCKTPWGHWKTTTFTCGLRCDGLVAPWVLEGPMTGDAFLIYVEKVLAPTLSQGDTVIIDNLSSHKVAGVREAIEQKEWSVANRQIELAAEVINKYVGETEKNLEAVRGK